MRIAEDIAFHVRMGMLAGQDFAWLVLTFDDEVFNFSEYKPQALQRLASFVRWLRGSCGMPDLQYAATYELQKSGRLHINLIAGPWKYVSHYKLLARWGARVSVEYVQDSQEIGTEAAASYSPEGLAGYVSKLDQAVPKEWGRRVSFSKNWRRVPKHLRDPKRRGEIEWQMPDGVSLRVLETLIQDGKVIKIQDGEYAHSGQYYLHPECDCFEYVQKFRTRPPDMHTSEINDGRSYELMRELIATGGAL